MSLQRKDFRNLGVLLLLGLVHGLVYLFLVPPWQHYDEPNHFEYIWLIQERGILPQSGDYDQSMRRAVAESMIEYGFFKGLKFSPNLDVQDTPIWIGTYDQLTNPPVYYLLAALPLKVFSIEDVTDQLYAVRSISLVLYLVTLFAAWGIAIELTQGDHALRIFLPFSLALLPGFTDLMTSVNSDVAAVAFFSLFLWGCVRLILSGFTILNFSWAILAMLLAILTKETSFVALPLFFVALILALFKGSRQRLAWALFIFGGVVGLVVIFTWGDAAFWARDTTQSSPTRRPSGQAPLGNYALQIEVQEDSINPDRLQIHQILGFDRAKDLSGKTITIGAWMWADRPITAKTPILNVFYESEEFYQVVDIDEQPRFISFSVNLGESTSRSWLTLAPFQWEEREPVTIYFDGLIVVEGDYPTSEEPKFTNNQATRGTWGGKPFENLLRNASAEIPWVQVRPWIDAAAAKYLPDNLRPSWILAMLADWPGAGWFHKLAASRLFRTFWGKFGWGHVPLMGSKPYRVIVVLAAIGLFGAVLAVFRRRRTLNYGLLLFFFLVLLGIWAPSFVRGVNYIFRRPYFPVARYAYPGVIPTMMVFNVGYLELARYGERWLRFPAWIKYLIFFIVFGGMALWSILSIFRYYYI